MSESLQDALASVLDRCVPAPGATLAPLLDPSYFARVPEEVLFNPAIGHGPMRLLTTLECINRKHRARGTLDTTNPQLAQILGVSVNTILRWLRDLVEAGVIERVGRTCRRVIRILTRFVTGEEGPTHQSPLAPNLVSIHTNGGVNSHHQVGEFTPEMVTSPRVEREKSLQTRPSPSGPPGGGTTPAARTGTGGPPPRPAAPAPPQAAPVAPVLEARRAEGRAAEAERACLLARWEALPAPTRAALEEEARAADPALAAIPALFRAACLDAMAAMAAAERSARDAAALDALLDADDSAMKMAAARTLCDSGRADLVVARIDFAVGKKTGR